MTPNPKDPQDPKEIAKEIMNKILPDVDTHNAITRTLVREYTQALTLYGQSRYNQGKEDGEIVFGKKKDEPDFVRGLRIKIAELEASVKSKEEEIAQFKSDNQELRDILDLKDNELQASRSETKESNNKIRALECKIDFLQEWKREHRDMV